MMWYWGSGVHWWGWLFMAVGMIVFWGLVIWAFMSVVGRAHDHRSPSGPVADEEPEEILARRLAAGDISVDEYQHRLELLRERDRTGAVPR
jgi:putative membrane protein